MTGRLPNWLAHWLGVELGGSGDAATWRLDSAWSLAPWVSVLLVLVIVSWVALVYACESSSAGRRYRAALATLRLAAIAVLLVMLAQWALAVRLSGPPTIALAVDRSASMGIADRYDDAQLAGALREQLDALGLTGATRLNLAKLIATGRDGELVGRLADRYRLAVYFVGDGVERVPASADKSELVRRIRDLSASGPGSEATRLGDAVRQVLDDSSGAPPAAIVLLSDGVTTAGVPLAEAAQEARGRGVPLWAVGLGSDQPPRDVELADVLVDDAVFAGDLVSFQVEIKSSGYEGQPARVVLRRAEKGDSPLFSNNGGTSSSAEGREKGTVPVAEAVLTLGAAGQVQSVQLVDRPTATGDVEYTVEVVPRDDETSRENNRQRRTVAVRDEPIRVLLVAGYPSYEFRYLKTLLGRDESVELRTYLQDADPDYAEQDRTALRSFPTGREALLDYDVVLVCDVDPRLVPRSAWGELRSFVAERGGGVVMVAGPRYLPWLYGDVPEAATLLPFDLGAIDLGPGGRLPADVTSGFTVRPTPLGERYGPMQLGDSPSESAEIWAALPPLYWLVPVDRLKPAARVLAEHPTHTGGNGRNLPVFVLQPVGAGKVLFHAVDSTWRWRIGVGDVYFARYWVQTIRYLARAKLGGGRGAELSTDRREYQRGEAVEVRARFLDPRLAPAGDAVSVAVETIGQPRRQLVLRRNPAVDGVFEGTLTDPAEGQYRLLVTDPPLPGDPPSTQFTVVALPDELARPEMDRAALAGAVETTHGQFFTIVDADRLLDELPAGRRVPVENLPPVPIWNRWWLLTVFLACICGEWILRKRRGML